MKAFVYTKSRNSRKVAELIGITSVQYNKAEHEILLTDGTITWTFDTRVVKITLYQN